MAATLTAGFFALLAYAGAEELGVASGNNIDVGGDAELAVLVAPAGLALDSAGNVYVAESGAHRVRKIDTVTGTISTIAGTGSPGFAGDGGPATAARLESPFGITIDDADNLYIADSANQRIRKVTLVNGQITTVAGSGSFGFSGDGGPANIASLKSPRGVAIDDVGDLIIADTFNNRVRRVDGSTGIISTVAGNGEFSFGGDAGSAVEASFRHPEDVAVDGQGNVFVADTENHRIRKILAGTGIIITIAGDGVARYAGDGGAARTASLNQPRSITVDANGNLYIADTNNHRIRSVDFSVENISLQAGDGVPRFNGDNRPAFDASIESPAGIVVSETGDIFLSDTGNSRVRTVPSTTRRLNTIAGPGGAIIEVTTDQDVVGDDGLCALREAISSANTDTSVGNCPAGRGSDTIVLEADVTYVLSISGPNEDANQTGDLDISDDLTVQGNDATVDAGFRPVVTTVSDLGDRVFDVSPDIVVSFHRVAITGGSAVNRGGGVEVGRSSTVLFDGVSLIGNVSTQDSGGLHNDQQSVVTIVNSVVADNSAPNGGGIGNNNDAILDIINSTISSNFAERGGGIVTDDATQLTLKNATVSSNVATTSAAGIWGLGNVVLLNSIVSGNLSPSNPDCEISSGGSATSEGHNLIGENCGVSPATGDQFGSAQSYRSALLGPLEDNGGPTLTHALLEGSLAIESGDPSIPGTGEAACELHDQRGVARPQGTRCDIGAYEYQNTLTSDLAVTKTTPRSLVAYGEVIDYTLTVTNNGPDDAANVIVVDTLPEGMSMAGETAGCTQAGRTVTCQLADLPAGQSAEIIISISVPMPNLTNHVTVSSGNTDPISDNDADEVDIVVTQPSNVPASRTLELFLIAGLLFLVTTIYLRQRRSPA